MNGRERLRRFALLILAGGLPCAARAESAPPPPRPATFPVIDSADLTGRGLRLPRDLPAGRTIVILAFTRPQQAQVDGWIRGLALRPTDSNWLELPVIAQPGALMRLFIDDGMRRGIPDVAVRRHVVTLYTDKPAFLASVGVTAEAKVVVLVVDREGRLLARASGAFTAAEGRRILATAQ